MKKRMTVKQLANLRQNQSKTVEELEDMVKGASIDFENEDRVKQYLDKMSVEYDLDDMNANDRSALLDLAKISIDIEDTQKLYRVKLANENVDWFELEKITNNLKVLRADRSKIEYDLNITRRSRQSSEEASPVVALDDWKKRAKKMLEERLNYVYCPKCKMLLSVVWFLNPTSGNSLTLTCSRESCNYKFSITGSELITNKNKNLVYNAKGNLVDDVLDT